MSRSRLVVAVDLGGTNLRLALVDAQGSIVQRVAEPTRAGRGAAALVQWLAAAIAGLPQQAGIPPEDIAAVGLGIPGLVEPETGKVVKAPNLPELDGQDLGLALSARLPWPVVLENDANLFAWGEASWGAGQGESNLLGLTLGTGVGGGLVLKGRLWSGAQGTAAEIGHMTIDPQGQRCNCGNTGCLETFASATWTVRWLTARLQAGEPSTLQDLWQHDPGEVTAQRIHAAAQAGDSLARQALVRVGWALGIAIANVVHLLGVPLVLIGGKMAQAWDCFLPALEEELSRRLTFFPRAALQVRPAVLGDNAGLLGAAKLAWDRPRRSEAPEAGS
jgi:glucokinase